MFGRIVRFWVVPYRVPFENEVLRWTCDAVVVGILLKHLRGWRDVSINGRPSQSFVIGTMKGGGAYNRNVTGVYRFSH